MTQQLVMWPLLGADPAPRDCDQRNDEAEGFRLVPPAIVPRNGTAEARERSDARAREIQARKEGQRV